MAVKTQADNVEHLKNGLSTLTTKRHKLVHSVKRIDAHAIKSFSMMVNTGFECALKRCDWY